MAIDTPKLPTRIVAADRETIAEGGKLLRDGRLVAFPTETVYGLGANALDADAVAAIFVAKERPRFNPLIVHVRDRDEAGDLVHFHPLAAALAEAFWPGGLTLVLPRREPCPLALLVSGGLPTAAIRAPRTRSPVPWWKPPAYPSPRRVPTAPGASARRAPPDAADELQGRVDLILDGGPCPLGIESTVIGFDGERPILLRPGAVPREDIENLVGRLLDPDGAAIQAPGMMASHYAPRAKLRLNAKTVEAGEALLAFGPDPPKGSARTICNLSASGDLREAAANLFSMLRQLDKSGAKTIAVMPIPVSGLGEAINDRLARAAAPRE